MSIYFDSRWVGDHGIGRFARVLDEVLNLPHLKIGGSPVSVVEPLRLALAVAKLPKRSAILSPGFNAPLFPTDRLVLTIHDLNHIDVGRNSWLKKFYYEAVLKPACRSSFRVLTVSEFSRNRIAQWARIDRQAIVNIGNGVGRPFEQAGPVHTVLHPYFLCVSNRKSHKNEVRLIKAFAEAQVDREPYLYFTGENNPELRQLVASLGVGERIAFLGHVADIELAALYRGAVALLFPSLYEGFGLPVIEAMACGTPVLTSNTTSLPEVAGDAAILVDPLNVDAIRAGIEHLYRDKDLRLQCRERGLLRAELYRWENVVSNVRSILNLFAQEMSLE